MTTVFVTGGTGLIGSEVCKKLFDKGYKVVIYDFFLNYARDFNEAYPAFLSLRMKDLKDKATIIKGDIRHQAHLQRALDESKPDYFIHLAAVPLANISSKFSEEIFDVNIKGTRNVLEAVREYNKIKRFIFTSSSMVYGNFVREPADEEHPTNPIELYGGTKLAGEILTKTFSNHYKIDYTIIRPSAVYGHLDANKRMPQMFIENALLGKPLVLDGGGVSKLDFSHVRDVAEGFVLAMESEKAVNQTFNLTRGNARSVREFAEIIKKHIPSTQLTVGEADKFRPNRGTLDISKARKLIGYEPKVDIEQGIAEYVEFLRQNMHVIK